MGLKEQLNPPTTRTYGGKRYHLAEGPYYSRLNAERRAKTLRGQGKSVRMYYRRGVQAYWLYVR